MSADNYLYLRKYRGRYYIEDGCASTSPPSGPPRTMGFKNLDLALKTAVLEAHNGYYEYGLSVSKVVAKEIAETTK